MTASEIKQLIVDTATAYGIDPQIALNMAIAESSLNPNAKSGAGAEGLWLGPDF